MELTINKVIENLLLERNAEKIEYTTKESIDEHKNCCDLAISALKKQIPRKLKEESIYDIPICPHCQSKYIYDYSEDKEFNFCPECGQAIDWSEE